jgi:hypothetical protein
MNYIYVGKFTLGLNFVELYANPETMGGSVDFLPERDKTDLTKIYVGLNDEWPEVLSSLLHEAYEAVLIDQGLRYRPKPSYSSESSNYIFIMTHNQFDEANTRVAFFLKDALPKLEQIYEKEQRKKSLAAQKKRKMK